VQEQVRAPTAQEVTNLSKKANPTPVESQKSVGTAKRQTAVVAVTRTNQNQPT
jgi:hypothetical protein